MLATETGFNGNSGNGWSDTTFADHGGNRDDFSLWEASLQEGLRGESVDTIVAREIGDKAFAAIEAFAHRKDGVAAAVGSSLIDHESLRSE